MNMKKKVLTAAVVAAMGTGSASAVNLSQDGTGEVALVPYYTVQPKDATDPSAGSWETLISIVNTTSDTKALKVRFREGYNSHEVFDFNLYLSPEDVWVAKVTDNGADGAKIVPYDNSCTMPNLSAQEYSFLDYDYAQKILGGADKTDGGPSGISRVREGYIEVFEMSVITDTAVQGYIVHDANGMPKDCPKVLTTFTNSGGNLTWSKVDAQPSGGIAVAAALINVTDGSELSVPVTHLAAFSDEPKHFDPGTLNPSLASVSPAISQVLNNRGPGQEAQLWNDVWAGTSPFDLDEDTGVDAVSAVLMTTSVSNEYTVNPAVNAETDWVITFPTKSFYARHDAHSTIPATDVARKPFTDAWQVAGTNKAKSCESVGISIWDREEAQTETEILPSPRPPENDLTDNLCNEVNVISMKAGSNVLGSQNLRSVWDIPYTAGWMRVTFDVAEVVTKGIGNFLDNDSSDNTYYGLPAIGFRATRLGNINVGQGAAYAVSEEHIYDNWITSGSVDAVTGAYIGGVWAPRPVTGGFSDLGLSSSL